MLRNWGHEVRPTPFHPKNDRALVETISIRALRDRKSIDWIYAPHRLEFHMVILVTEGRGIHLVDTEKVRLSTGEVLSLRPGQIHSFAPGQAFDGYMVLFPPEALPEQTEPRLPPRQVTRPSEIEFGLLIDLAQWIGDGSGHGENQRVATHLLAAFTELVVSLEGRNPEKEGGGASLFRRFDALVQLHLSHRPTVDWFATELGVSTRTLHRACLRAEGCTPRHWVDSKVITESKRLLAHTNKAVEVIARDLGFSESTNFVKYFRRRVESTPAAFRRKIRGQQ